MNGDETEAGGKGGFLIRLPNIYLDFYDIVREAKLLVCRWGCNCRGGSEDCYDGREVHDSVCIEKLSYDLVRWKQNGNNGLLKKQAEGKEETWREEKGIKGGGPLFLQHHLRSTPLHTYPVIRDITAQESTRKVT